MNDVDLNSRALIRIKNRFSGDNAVTVAYHTVFVWISAVTLLFLSPFTNSVLANPLPSNWKGVNQEVLAGINLAQQTFLTGDIGYAKELLSDAYFEKFESMGMEMVVKKYISSARAYELERLFGTIRKGMTANDSLKVDQEIIKLTEALNHDAAILDQKNIAVEGAGYIIQPAIASVDTETTNGAPTQAKSSPGDLSPQEIAKEIEQLFQKALALYKQGNSRESKGVVSDAYFDIFEGLGMEGMVAAKSSSLKSEFESKFANIRGLIEKGSSTDQLEAAVLDLTKQLHKVAGSLDSSTSWFGLFVSSFFIIVREGFEAILIISALIAYLRRTDNHDKVKIVGLGALAAIVLSVVTALLFLKIYTQSGESQENLEGITMLIAAAVLFYVSYWLTSKAEAARWMDYIQNQVMQSIGKGSIFTLGLASFFVVYREGAETILFYSALFSNAEAGGSVSIWGGFAVGCLVLTVIYYIFKYGTAKIPIRPFFTVTSVILYYMAFVFVGKGILELQVGGLIRTTPIDWLPRIGFLGVFPTLESMILQGAFLLAAIIALGYLFILQPFRAQGHVLKDIVHTLGDLHTLHDRVEHIRTHTAGAEKLTASNNGKEIKKISGHLTEIDRYSHELLGHLESLESELATIWGNVKK